MALSPRTDGEPFEARVAPGPVLATCHCGAVAIEVAFGPAEVTDCNCSICRRYGVLWAYYRLAEVNIRSSVGSLDAYSWDDRSVDFNRCPTCGCVTHWSSNHGRDRVGVNARLLPVEVLSSVRRRRLDGAVTEEYLD